MSEARLTCLCGEPLRSGANYCYGCGLEVRPTCPACGEERRWLPTITREGLPWCENRQALLYACEHCGRWLLPGTRVCPDPDCASRVLPSDAVHTGRRWDGRGGAAGWTWPVQRQTGSAGSLFSIARWDSPDPVHAAAAAQGRLYVWSGANFLAPEAPFGLTSRHNAEASTASGNGALWRSALGAAVRPAPGLPPEERIAIAGAGAVLASERSFVLAALHSRSDSVRIEGGAPLAQAGGPFWWVGWSQPPGETLLQYAPIGETWDWLTPTRAETPPEAALTPNSRLVLRDNLAYWPGQDGGVWRLHCETGAVEPILSPMEGLRQLWAEPDGPRTVREVQGRLLLGLGTPSGGRMPQEVPAGMGPLRDVFATAASVVVVGDRPLAFDAVSGERLHEANRPPGHWIGGALVEAPDGEPRLLTLTQEADAGRLSALKLSSGVEELLWMEANITPLTLLPVPGGLFLAHSRGVLRLME